MEISPTQIHLTTLKGISLFSGREFEGLYYYKSQTVHYPPTAAEASPPKNENDNNFSFFGLQAGSFKERSKDFARRLLEAHWAYGHLHFTKLRKLLGLKAGDDPDCAACTIAMSRQKALSKVKHNRSTRVNHRVHIDLGFTRGSEICFQLIVDDYTRESFLDVLDSKADALSSFQRLQRQRDNDHAPYSLAYVKTDSEPLYKSNAWDTHCKDMGIKREFSSRYRHDQHGVAERGMQAVGVSFRCMMI